MATSTERFGFTKPAGSDPASIVPLNSNTDLIEQYLGRTQDMIAPLYDDTATYDVGDIVTYESNLYKCITAISTAETFDPTKWEATTAVDEGGGGGSGTSAIEKTQAEYDALTPAQKTNGAIYMVQAGEQPQDTSGTFVTGSARYEKVEINCGFRPDYIEVTLPFSSGDTTAIYDASVSITTSTWEIPQEGNKYTIELGSVTGETGITDITDTGFKFRCNASNTRGVTCTFTASKEGQDAVNKIYYMGTEYANTNGGSGGSSEAEDINYDNTTSHLTATNVQEAIDEVVANANTASEDILTLQNVQGYDKYDETQTYAVGDYAIYNNIVYECTTAVTTAEPFDSTKWTATSIEQIIDGVKGDISQLNSSLTNLITTEVVNLGTHTIAQNDRGVFTASVAKQGYTPIGIVHIGLSSNTMTLGGFTLSGNTAQVVVWNYYGKASASQTVSVMVLYVKNF